MSKITLDNIKDSVKVAARLSYLFDHYLQDPNLPKVGIYLPLFSIIYHKPTEQFLMLIGDAGDKYQFLCLNPNLSVFVIHSETKYYFCITDAFIDKRVLRQYLAIDRNTGTIEPNEKFYLVNAFPKVLNEDSLSFPVWHHELEPMPKFMVKYFFNPCVMAVVKTLCQHLRAERDNSTVQNMIPEWLDKVFDPELDNDEFLSRVAILEKDPVENKLKARLSDEKIVCSLKTLLTNFVMQPRLSKKDAFIHLPVEPIDNFTRSE